MCRRHDADDRYRGVCDCAQRAPLTSTNIAGCYGRLKTAQLAMQIATTHFGPVEIEVDNILVFPHGVIAFEDCRHWVLLGDAENPAFAWLQSVSRAEVVLPVVSPRRFAPDYSVHVGRGQLLPLELAQFDEAYVLTVVSQSDGDLT